MLLCSCWVTRIQPKNIQKKCSPRILLVKNSHPIPMIPHIPNRKQEEHPYYSLQNHPYFPCECEFSLFFHLHSKKSPFEFFSIFFHGFDLQIPSLPPFSLSAASSCALVSASSREKSPRTVSSRVTTPGVATIVESDISIYIYTYIYIYIYYLY